MLLHYGLLLKEACMTILYSRKNLIFYPQRKEYFVNYELRQIVEVTTTWIRSYCII